jgi:hypothetical protein
MIRTYDGAIFLTRLALNYLSLTSRVIILSIVELSSRSTYSLFFFSISGDRFKLSLKV